MKQLSKKWLVLLLLVVFALCVTLTACDNDEGDDGDGDNNPIPLAAPVIDINNGVISWSAVEHATGYTVYCDGVAEKTNATSPYTIPTKAAGTYNYTVVAVGDGVNYSNSSASNSKPYTVDGSSAEQLNKPVVTLNVNVLSWEADDNAASYTVYCDGAVEKENATSPYTIPAKEVGSYSYTVVAVGDGENYSSSASSTPVVYVVSKLATPTNVRVDELYQPAPRLTWNPVEHASGYLVSQSYNGGEATTQTVETNTYAVDFGEYGNYTFTVKALAGDNPLYKDSDASPDYTYNYSSDEATPLDKPVVTLEGITLSWNVDENAVSYIVYMNSYEGTGTSSRLARSNVQEATIDVEDAVQGKLSYTVSPKDTTKAEAYYTYTVVAVGDGATHSNSLPSNASDRLYPFNSLTISYEDGTISWNPAEARDPVSRDSGDIVADQFLIYCNGEQVAETAAGYYNIPDNLDNGIYLYYVIAVDSNDNHLPSYHSNYVAYSKTSEIALGGKVHFAASNYVPVYIQLADSVELNLFYQLKLTLTKYDSSAETFEYPYVSFFGSEHEDFYNYPDLYAEDVTSTNGEYVVNIALTEGFIKISLMGVDLNYAEFDLELLTTTITDRDPELPGEGGLKVEGDLDIGSFVYVRNLPGGEYAEITILTALFGGSVEYGKSYELWVMADSGLQLAIVTDMSLLGSVLDHTPLVESNGVYKCVFTASSSIFIINYNDDDIDSLMIWMSEAVNNKLSPDNDVDITLEGGSNTALNVDDDNTPWGDTYKMILVVDGNPNAGDLVLHVGEPGEDGTQRYTFVFEMGTGWVVEFEMSNFMLYIQNKNSNDFDVNVSLESLGGEVLTVGEDYEVTVEGYGSAKIKLDSDIDYDEYVLKIEVKSGTITKGTLTFASYEFASEWDLLDVSDYYDEASGLYIITFYVQGDCIFLNNTGSSDIELSLSLEEGYRPTVITLTLGVESEQITLTGNESVVVDFDAEQDVEYTITISCSDPNAAIYFSGIYVTFSESNGWTASELVIKDLLNNSAPFYVSLEQGESVTFTITITKTAD